MGADLLGYTLVRPAKGAERIAEKHLKQVKSVLSDSKLSDHKKVSRLNTLGVSLYDTCGDIEIADTEFISRVRADLETVQDLALKEFYRDLNSRYATVGRKTIEILFAGELSWGDEPDGTAYQILKQFVRLGISQAWENALK